MRKEEIDLAPSPFPSPLSYFFVLVFTNKVKEQDCDPIFLYLLNQLEAAPQYVCS